MCGNFRLCPISRPGGGATKQPGLPELGPFLPLFLQSHAGKMLWAKSWDAKFPDGSHRDGGYVLPRLSELRLRLSVSISNRRNPVEYAVVCPTGISPRCTVVCQQ